MLLFLAFLATVAANGCTSLASLSHGTTACISGEGTPDCTYIQANANTICSSLLPSWEIVNGPACNLRGQSYGCTYSSGTFNTQDTFCCVLTGGVVPSSSSSYTTAATFSPSSSASYTTAATFSPSSSVSVSSTSSPSVSVSSTSSPSASTSYMIVMSVSAMPSWSATTTTATSNATAIIIANSTTLPVGSYIGIGIGSSVALLLCVCVFYVCYTRRTASTPERRKSVSIEIVKQARRQSELTLRSTV